MKKEEIQNKKIKVIAEVACAHEGDFKRLKKFVQFASEAKVDYIKFQVLKADKLVTKNHHEYNLFKKIEFSEEKWLNIAKYCKELKLKILADVFDNESFDIAKKMGVKGYKIHSTNLSNPYLLKPVAKTKKLILLSVSGATRDEIKRAIQKNKKEGNKNIILMHGFQSFPTKIEETSLNMIPRLKKEFKLEIGIQDHIDAESHMAMIMPLLGIAKGCIIVEKHFTLNRKKKGIDYESSLNPNELKKLTNDIRLMSLILGNDSFNLSKDEIKYRAQMKKSIVAAGNITKGAKIKFKDLEFKRAINLGLSPGNAELLVNKKAKKDINIDELVLLNMVE